MFAYFFKPKRSPAQILSALGRGSFQLALDRDLTAPQLIGELGASFTGGETKLIAKLARCLGLTVASALHLPNEQLITKTGYKADTLQQHGLIPQNVQAPHNYALVCANPLALDLAQYRAHGIPVCLAPLTLINATWHNYISQKAPQDNRPLVESALSALASKAQDLGATIVYFGKQDYDYYEITTANRSFCGKLTAQFIALLEDFMTNRFEAEISAPTDTISRLLLRRVYHSSAYPLELHLLNGKPEASSRTSSSCAVPRVAIVDDDRRYTELLTQIITRHGWQVLCYEDSRLALESIRLRTDIDLIISDVHMPNLDGYQLVQELHNYQCHLPILMLTSDCDNYLEARLAELGVGAVINKQQSPAVLFAWCNNLLRKNSLTGTSGGTPIKC